MYSQVLAFVTLLGSALAQTPGALSQVANYGPPPALTGTAAPKMYIYVPKALKESPGVVVANHMCTGSASGFANTLNYKTYAEKYNFVAIYPESPPHAVDGGKRNCWDVSSRATLKHGGGGESEAIVNMVKWAQKKYNADPKKAFVAGMSSGAMMTNVLAAAYPDVFSAGIVYVGVPAGCFQSASGGVAAWNGTCSGGKSINTPAAWANVVKGMAPAGYSGPWPKMMIYHGGSDTTLRPQNYEESVKQWSGIHGYDATAKKTTNGYPKSGFVTKVYGEKVVGSFSQAMTHNNPVFLERDMEWFGFKAPPNAADTV